MYTSIATIAASRRTFTPIEMPGRRSSGWRQWSWHTTLVFDPRELRDIRRIVVDRAAEFLEARHHNFPPKPGERVTGVRFDDDTLSVDLADGRTITVPLAWYPRLLDATKAQRENWRVCGGGFGIHWPEVDEDLSTQGLLEGVPAARCPRKRASKQHIIRDARFGRGGWPG